MKNYKFDKRSKNSRRIYKNANNFVFKFPTVNILQFCLFLFKIDPLQRMVQKRRPLTM